MPEYALPYALYLLSFRKESPIAGGTNADPVLNGEDETDGDTDVATEEARRKMLGKRLKCLFEPLVQSLGESADNISFLLRMTDVFGNSKWQPVDSRRCGAASDSAQHWLWPRHARHGAGFAWLRAPRHADLRQRDLSVWVQHR